MDKNNGIFFLFFNLRIKIGGIWGSYSYLQQALLQKRSKPTKCWDQQIIGFLSPAKKRPFHFISLFLPMMGLKKMSLQYFYFTEYSTALCSLPSKARYTAVAISFSARSRARYVVVPDCAHKELPLEEHACQVLNHIL